MTQQWSRRLVLGGGLSLVAGAVLGQGVLSREGGVLRTPAAAPIPPEKWAMQARAPWAQLMRTFGNPVLEGHIAVRVAPETGQVCVVMWDLGDRVLGLGQLQNQDPDMLWEIVAASMSRKPDIAIGRPDILYESDHFEAAHWRLDESTAARIGRTQEAASAQVRQWIVPGKTTARAIEPVLLSLLPPAAGGAAYVLWHEPDPAIKSRTTLGVPYTIGQNADLDASLAWAFGEGLMIAGVSAAGARFVLDQNGGPGLFPVFAPDGAPLGRVRLLRV